MLVAWDPDGEGNQHLQHQIEMIQRRAARFVTGDWRTTRSITALIKTIQWQTLEQGRQQSRLISFAPSTVREWNALPPDIHNAL